MTLKPEQIEQIKVFDWIRFNKLDDVSFHPANERACSVQHGSILKRMGVTAGVPDIFIMKPARGFHGLIIELKAGKGKLSLAQSKFLENLNREGYLAVVRYGADEAIKTIQNYLTSST